VKNPSKEGPGGVKSLLSENAPTSNWKYEGLRINTGGSNVIFGWPHLENVVRTIRSTLEFKIVPA
jgi:hypothetical protein